MTTDPPGDVTQLLQDWSKGNKAALEKLMPLVYRELRQLARSYLRNERPDHTLQTTALVNEAYLRLVDQNNARWQSRSHFFGIAAQAMRRILVDHARKRLRVKRGSGEAKVPYDDGKATPTDRGLDLVALDDCLRSLAEIDPRQSKIVELKYFGGLTIEETAGVLNLSPATVKREWSTAKAWLRREMRRGKADEK